MLLGDKQEADKYKQYNEGHVADIIQIGASPWATDWLGETKSPLEPLYRASGSTRPTPAARPWATW